LSDARTPTSHTHATSDITSGTLDIARLPVGTTTGTVAAGDDARLTDARTPTAHKTTHATGGTDALTPADIGAAPATGIDPTAITGTAVIDSDARLSDARTPTSHTHGNLTDDGKLGTTAGLPVVTTTDGAVTTLALGTAGQVLSVNSTADGLEFATGSSLTGTGSVENSALRADGTGGSALKNSGLVIEDAIVSVTGITGDAGTNVITAPGTAFANGQPIRFTALTGGTGLNTTTNYFVVNPVGATFQVETSIGGGAINFTTNITAGTLLTGHSVQTNVTLSENTTETNSALVLTPKGTGAFILGPKPDGTATGGNARGARAVDLQTLRRRRTQVASIQFSNLWRAKQYIFWHAVCSLRRKWQHRLGTRSSVQENSTASGFGSYIGGRLNSASASVACLGGGRSNQASAEGAVIAGGGSQTLSLGNTASAIFWNIRRICRTCQRIVWPCRLMQMVVSQQRRRPTRPLRHAQQNHDEQRSRAFLGWFSSARLTIPSGKIFAFTINISGVKSDGSAVAHYLRQYCLKNVAGTTTEVYAPVTIGTDNAAGTTIALSADDTNNALKVEVTGILDETWRWVASVDAVEIAYGS
jgi:hypothetical protein